MKVQDWFQIRGDETLALDWPGVDENSIIWEIGGYEGRWALQMAEKYSPLLYVFEPQEWAHARIVEKLAGHNAKIFPFGLWPHNGKMRMGEYETDGASMMKPGSSFGEVKDVYSFFIHEQISQIDVCLMNIEGGEFVLLPYMIGMGMMESIRYFWLQWHTFVPSGPEKMIRLKQMLSLTHKPYWDCGLTAMAWKRK